VNDEDLSTDALRLTVKGTGFDATLTTANTIKFGLLTTEIPSEPLQDIAVKGLASQTTLTQLELVFTHLSPIDAVNFLQLDTTVSSTWSTTSSEGVTVSKLVAADPSVNVDRTNLGTLLSSDTHKLTIWGQGFDAYNTTHNLIKIVTSSNRFESLGCGTGMTNCTSNITGIVSKSTVTNLVFSFYRLNAGHTSNDTLTSVLSADIVVCSHFFVFIMIYFCFFVPSQTLSTKT